MQKISVNAAKALLSCNKFSGNNTYVLAGDTYAEMYLFGNNIARYDAKSDTLEVNFRGWFTNTTKDRLNAVLWEYNKTRPFWAGCDYPHNGWIEVPPREK